MKKVVLYSGGLDSFCLAHHVKPDLLVYFDTGLEEQFFEQQNIERMARVGALPAPVVYDDRFMLAEHRLKNDTMPFRNLFFLAAAFTYGDTVYLGSTASDVRLDHGQRFAAKALDVLHYLSANPDDNPPGLLAENMSILTPFERKTKSRFVKEFIDGGGDIRHLLMTRSCYRPKGQECGKCAACIKKSIAFVNNSLPITFFENDPTNHYEWELETRTKRTTPLKEMLIEEVQNAIWITNERKRL